MGEDLRALDLDEPAVRAALFASLTSIELTGVVEQHIRKTFSVVVSDTQIFHRNLGVGTRKLRIDGQPVRENAMISFKLDPHWDPLSSDKMPRVLVASVREIERDDRIRLQSESAVLLLNELLAAAARIAELERIEAEVLVDRESLEVQAQEFHRVGGPTVLAFLEQPDESLPPLDHARREDPPADVLNAVFESLSAAGLSYPLAVIRRAVLGYLLAASLGQLLLFAGPPGSGKSSLASAIGERLGAHSPAVIPVRPGWLDATDLLGFYDPRDERFVPAPFLDCVLDARRLVPTGRSYIVVLDELNLARIENYGADILSQLERAHEPRSQGTLRLYARSLLTHAEQRLRAAVTEGDPRAVEDRGAVVSRLRATPPEVELPGNLVLAGTLNDDETTRELSPKVKDRSVVVRIPVSEPELPGRLGLGDALVAWHLTVDWLADLPMLANETATEAAEVWDSARYVVGTQPRTVAHLSHRSARAAALLPAIAGALNLDLQTVLDDFLTIRVLPWVSFNRVDDTALTGLADMRVRGEERGLSGFVGEITNLLENEDDDVVQYLR